MGKTNLICCQLKIKLDGEIKKKKKARLRTPSPHTAPFLPRLHFTPSFTTPLPPPHPCDGKWDWEWEVSSLSCGAPSSLRSSPTAVQDFRKRLFQPRPSKGHSSCQKACMGSLWAAASSCDIHLLQSSVLHCLHCGYLFHHGSLQIPGEQTASLWAQGNLRSGAWSPSCPPPALPWLLQGCSLPFSSPARPCSAQAETCVPLAAPAAPRGSAVACGRAWSQLGLAGPGCVCHRAAPASPRTGPAARTQAHDIQIYIIKETSFNQDLTCTYLSIYDDVNL